MRGTAIFLLISSVLLVSGCQIIGLTKEQEKIVTENWETFRFTSEDYLVRTYKDVGIELEKEVTIYRGEKATKYHLTFQNSNTDSIQTIEYWVVDGIVRDCKTIGQSDQTTLYLLWTNLAVGTKVFSIALIPVMVWIFVTGVKLFRESRGGVEEGGGCALMILAIVGIPLLLWGLTSILRGC